MTKFTQLEIKMLEMLSYELNCSNYEDEIDNGNVCLLIESDLRAFPGGANVARGVVSSLVKKDIMCVENNSGRQEYWATNYGLKKVFEEIVDAQHPTSF